MRSDGSIIAAVIVKGAILFAYDTRSHIKGIKWEEWDVEQRKPVEAANNKVHLVQYCALAAAGSRGFSKKLHSRLLTMVTNGLKNPSGPRQVKADDAMKFLRNCILAELANPAERSQSNVKCCRLILGMWEMNERGVFTPILRRSVKDGVSREVEYCALGINEGIAQTVLRENYRPNMTVTEGKDLLVRAIKEAAFKDHRRILGGCVEVCVLMPRDFRLLPLSRRQQNLDRSITFFNAATIPEEREQAPRKRICTADRGVRSSA